jgi:NAD(P)-dependent dehydrogenase (short-subunit alcohol dehydrogenase family)
MSANGKVAVVTGASSGIGLEAAKALAKAGWRVIGVGRNAEHCASALKELQAAANGAEVEILRGDLAIMVDTARLAKEIASRTGRIDVLMNNAGGTPADQVITAEGNEETFAGNHLGPFLLTKLLLPVLESTAAKQPKGSVRVINTSSSAHEYIEGMNWDDLQSLKTFVTSKAYCAAKLANIYFNRALARRVAPKNIVVHAMHPGVVATNFASHGDANMQKFFADYGDKASTPAQGADTLIWLAMDAEPGKSTGGYFFERAPAAVSTAGQDDALAERLWTVSEALVANAVH